MDIREMVKRIAHRRFSNTIWNLKSRQVIDFIWESYLMDTLEKI